MTRMASSSMLVLLALVAHCHGELTCVDQLQEANAALEAMKIKYAELEKKFMDADECDLRAYVTAQAIVNVVGDVTGSLGVSSLDISSVVEATQKNIPVGDLNITQVTEAASNGYDAAKEAIISTVGIAQGLHDEHVLPHASEYYKAAAPHMEAAQKAYYDQLHPHVADVSQKISTAFEQTKTGFREKFKTVFEQATLSVSAAFEGTDTSSTQLNKLYAPQQMQFFGYKKTFTHGFLDIALFFVQFITNLYVCLLILWHVCAKLVWRIGVKLGFKTVKTSFWIGTTTTSLAFQLFFKTFSVIFFSFMLGLFCVLGVSLMHGIEKNAKLGIDVGLRMAIGSGIGFVLYMLVYCCCCCKKRKEKTEENGKKNGKTNGSSTSRPKDLPRSLSTFEAEKKKEAEKKAAAKPAASKSKGKK
jgi:hypothetical protein